MAEGHPGGLREEAYALSIEQQEEVKTPLHSILSPIPHTMGLDPPPHGAYKPLKPPSGALQKILFMGTPHPPSLAQQVEDKASQDAQQDEAQQVEAKNQGGARKTPAPRRIWLHKTSGLGSGSLGGYDLPIMHDLGQCSSCRHRSYTARSAHHGDNCGQGHGPVTFLGLHGGGLAKS